METTKLDSTKTTKQNAQAKPSKQIKQAFVAPGRPKKRVFLGMLSLTTIFLAIVLFVVWYIGVPGLAAIEPWLPALLGAVFSAVILFAFLSIGNMVLAVSGLPFVSFLEKQSYELINALFPFAVYLGHFFGIRRRKLEASFIAVSNLLFRRRKIRVPASRLLVVTPHCLQLASCPHKITRDPHNCHRCGGCDIGALVTLADEMGFHFFVATGGTLARQIVKETRPKAVLAIACERDLTSGIQDVYPLPAVGVLNIRPNGPCYNTHVDMELVKEQLKEIIIPEEETNHGSRP